MNQFSCPFYSVRKYIAGSGDWNVDIIMLYCLSWNRFASNQRCPKMIPLCPLIWCISIWFLCWFFFLNTVQSSYKSQATEKNRIYTRFSDSRFSAITNIKSLVWIIPVLCKFWQREEEKCMHILCIQCMYNLRWLRKDQILSTSCFFSTNNIHGMYFHVSTYIYFLYFGRRLHWNHMFILRYLTFLYYLFSLTSKIVPFIRPFKLRLLILFKSFFNFCSWHLKYVIDVFLLLNCVCVSVSVCVRS